MKYAITIIVGLLLALCLMLITPKPAKAAIPENCGKHSEFIKVFKDKFQETGTALGIAGEVNLIEVYASPGGATWTIIVTQPNGISCIIAAGKDWMSKPVEILGKNS